MATTLSSNTVSANDESFKPKVFFLRWSFWASVLFYSVIGFFIINLILMVSTVVIDSFGKSWFRTVLPPEWTGQWYIDLASDHNMTQLLGNTFLVAIATTLLALVIAFPAAYVLARKEFRLKSLLYGLFLLPMLIPP